MKKKEVKLKTKLGNVLRALMFLVTICLIVYLFPKEGKFRYEFQKGSPWLHELLVAQYDFPIYKTDGEINAEMDSIEKEAQLYFNVDDNVVNEQFLLFKDDFEKKWDERVEEKIKEDMDGLLGKIRKDKTPEDYNQLKTRYQLFSNNILEFIYKKGIVKEGTEYKRVKKEGGTMLLVKNNSTHEVDVNEVFTTDLASEYIKSELHKAQQDSIVLAVLEIDFYDELDLDEYVVPNLTFDAGATQKLKASIKNEISITRGMIQEGERIISKGNIVDEEHYCILKSYEKEYLARLGSTKNFYIIIIGQIILIVASIFVLFLFLFNFRGETLNNIRRLAFILIIMVLFVFIASILTRFNSISIYLIPFAILPIIVRTFYDPRLALFIHLVAMLIIGFLVPNSFEFLFLQMITGIISIFSLDTIKRRGKLFLSSFFVIATYSFVYFGMAVIQEGNFESIEWMNFAWFAGNGALILTTYPLIFIFEKIFGFLSDVTLMELSDTNHPVLRKLNESAPGTFQHSLQVANLAEEAIYEIGGNPLLARTGALYHDIGKIDVPQYFVENQAPGHNPHDLLPYEKSAEVIIQHVISGIEIARKYKIPQQIIDFIATHQGNGKVNYFYRLYKNEHPNEEVNESLFTYPGPSPSTKETAVVMMADSVEAASRSLKVYTEESISELVEKIVAFQMSEKQLDDADISLKQITLVKEVLKRKLKNIYHSRLEYPEEKK